MESSHDNLLRLDSDLASISSSISSVFNTEDSRSTRSSGEITVSFVADVVVPMSLSLSPRFNEDGGSKSGNNELMTVTVTACQKCIGRNNKGVTWGFTSVIGRRREMEDAVAVIPGFISRACELVGGCTAIGSKTSGDVSPAHFFGVYDGHGGSQVAKFCAQRMHEVIAEECDYETVEASDWQKRWRTAFSSGFERIDNEVLTEINTSEMVGSTAVVAVLSGCQIIISNCGDSRVVLCRGAEIIPLTVDQKPDRADELLRIEGEGGKVINWNGARVFGVLAMSRAIGDRYLRPWIIPVPEISFTTRSEEDECLVLASDGLWDVMTNDEVGDVARRVLRRRRRLMADEKSPAQVVADNLTEIALQRNSSDNISVIVVDLKPKRKAPSAMK